MYYFLKNEKFNLEEYDFDIQCNPRFTRREHDVFSYFIKNFSMEKEFSEFNENKVKFDKKELKDIVNNIAKKVVYCYVFKNDTVISEFYFNIFDIVIFESKKVIYKFSNELRLSKKRGNFYSKINVMAFLQFRYTYTKEIFKLIVRQKERKGHMDYSLKEIKTLLNVDEKKYNRYFDLDNKVLNPTIKDIEYGEIGLWFEKIKNNNLKTSRIIGVRINFVNIRYIELHKDINDILKLNAEYIDDFTKAYEIIHAYRNLHTSEETISYVKNNLETIFKDS